MSDPESLPPGLYEQLITSSLETELGTLGDLAMASPLAEVDMPVRLADHLARVVERVLAGHGYSGNPQAQAELVNRLIEMLGKDRGADGEDVAEPPRLLFAVLNNALGGLATKAPPARPDIPLSDDSLLVNARSEPKLAAELRQEIKSADRIDLLCAF